MISCVVTSLLKSKLSTAIKTICFQGYVPPSYLTQKKDEAKPDKRTTQEQFREDVLKLSDAAKEASMKKRYTTLFQRFHVEYVLKACTIGVG